MRIVRVVPQVVQLEIQYDVCEYCKGEEESGSPFDVPERPAPAGWIRVATEPALNLRFRQEDVLMFCSWGCLEEFASERGEQTAPTAEVATVV